MNKDFPRIITLLRKERGLSQKKAASDLGISQALLSHYEKGIRECGLDFVVRIADYYDVSCDYLLGRTPDRSGATLTVEDIPEPDSIGKENVFRGSLLPTLNKKLITNSMNIIFDLLQQCANKHLTGEVSAYLMVSVYKMFRVVYSANSKNPQGLFSVPVQVFQGLSSAAQAIAETNASCIASGHTNGELQGLNKEHSVSLSPEVISSKYPLFASSLYNLIQSSEARMGTNRTGK